jgi:hypothetical protein
MSAWIILPLIALTHAASAQSIREMRFIELKDLPRGASGRRVELQDTEVTQFQWHQLMGKVPYATAEVTDCKFPSARTVPSKG